MPDVDLFSIELDYGNQAVLITTDIENNIAIHIVGAGEMLFQFSERVVLSSFDDAIPGIK